ncbi:MAG: hypothetical protein HC880_11165 [Bacteroidia bacterium]|nr:hypothetical protein [Bacteroidia bacterium]
MNLNDKELAYLQDQDFLPAKLRLMDRLGKELADLQAQLRTHIVQSALHFPAGTDLITGKISRGENYLNLPYLVLDFPRLINPENIFALRTMFWWGHEFSCTLHLQGLALDHYRNALLENLPQWRGKQIYLSVHQHPWAYYFRLTITA